MDGEDPSIVTGPGATSAAIGEPVRTPGPRPRVPRESPLEPPPGHVRVRLLLAYHGGSFRGIAPQPQGTRTVGNQLMDALATVLRQAEPPFLNMAGRTDAGVHAWGQSVHVDVTIDAEQIDWAKVHRSLNSMMAPYVVVRSVGVAPPGFDARRAAIFRRYRYSILNTELPDPLLCDSAWHVAEPLDLDAMRLAADPFLGEHDFTSFCRRPRGLADPKMTRVVHDVRWTDLAQIHPGLLRFEIKAASFCRQMVRAIVGFLVEVGTGVRRAGEVLSVLQAHDRSLASPLAPPHGLTLWEVGYPDGLGWPEVQRDS